MSPGARASSPLSLFFLFAFAYAISTALRSINAIIAPVLTTEFQLAAADLGLLSALYFLGFTATQLPLGAALDRLGPRKVEAVLMAVCLLGVLLFAQASSFLELGLARFVIGIGVAACLMAPMTGFRLWLSTEWRTRLSAWMLMTGALGMAASSVPVQWALPRLGWRGVFLFIAGCVVLAILALWFLCPRSPKKAEVRNAWWTGYAEIYKSPFFIALGPMFVSIYGLLVAVQTLWIGPWFTQVAGLSATDAAWSVLAVHAVMGLAYFIWGWATPSLAKRGFNGMRLLKLGLPLSTLLWLAMVLSSTWLSGYWNVLALMVCLLALSVTAQGQFMATSYFDPSLAGRVNTAYNVLCFAGAFALQWIIGIFADLAARAGYGKAVQLPFAFFASWLFMVAACLWFHRCAKGLADFEVFHVKQTAPA